MASSTRCVRNVYVSTSQRDKTAYPSPSDFAIMLPVTLKQVSGVLVKNYKFTPEPLVNANTSAVAYYGLTGTTNLSGTVYIAKGDYAQDVNQLLAAINAQLNSFDVQFTVSPSGLIGLAFAGSYINRFFAIPYCGMLRALGFTSGIYLYRTGYAPSTAALPNNMTSYANVATSAAVFRMVNNTDLILRINDVETIIANDGPSNRATAILMGSRSPACIIENTQCNVFPLLQIQYRIQQLRIQILNTYGEPYDLSTDDASFMIEFHHDTADLM